MDDQIAKTVKEEALRYARARGHEMAKFNHENDLLHVAACCKCGALLRVIFGAVGTSAQIEGNAKIIRCKKNKNARRTK